VNAPSADIPAVKDLEAHHPIASAWQPALRSLVAALVRGEFELQIRPAEVDPLEPGVAEQMRAYVADYGETLTALSAECWSTSVSQWMGDHWVILVDLATVESGISDLVLHAKVFETPLSFRIVVESIHVP